MLQKQEGELKGHVAVEGDKACVGWGTGLWGRGGTDSDLDSRGPGPPCSLPSAGLCTALGLYELCFPCLKSGDIGGTSPMGLLEEIV